MKMSKIAATLALTGAALAATALPASAAPAPVIRWQPPSVSAAINWAPTPQVIPPIKPGWYCWAVPWC